MEEGGDVVAWDEGEVIAPARVQKGHGASRWGSVPSSYHHQGLGENGTWAWLFQDSPAVSQQRQHSSSSSNRGRQRSFRLGRPPIHSTDRGHSAVTAIAEAELSSLTSCTKARLKVSVSHKVGVPRIVGLNTECSLRRVQPFLTSSTLHLRVLWVLGLAVPCSGALHAECRPKPRGGIRNDCASCSLWLCGVLRLPAVTFIRVGPPY